MDRIIWDAEEIRKEIRRLDRITGLNGAQLEIGFHRKGRSVGKFCWKDSGKMFFSFHTDYFDDPTMPPEVLLNTVRHEYAHYMDFLDRGTSSHGREWRQCCMVVGALPERYFDVQRANRLSQMKEDRKRRNLQLDEWIAGMYIDHPRFGMGRIDLISGQGLNRIAEVSFDAGMKHLGLGWVADHCPARTEETEVNRRIA